MKSDIAFGKLFQENPSMLTELMGVETDLPYKVTTETFKDIQRTADLCWYCEEGQEARIIEIQGYEDPFVYHRGELERILFHMRHPQKTVVLVLIFLNSEFDPQSAPWSEQAALGSGHYKKCYTW